MGDVRPYTASGVGSSAGAERKPKPKPKPKLLDRLREALRRRHYSRRTEKTYAMWVKGVRRPMDAPLAILACYADSV